MWLREKGGVGVHKSYIQQNISNILDRFSLKFNSASFSDENLFQSLQKIAEKVSTSVPCWELEWSA